MTSLALPLRLLALAMLGCLLGGVVSLVAVGFVDLVLWLNDILLVSPRSRVLAGDSPWLPWLTVLVPAAGGLVVGLICLGISDRRPHGPGDVIQAAQSPEVDVPPRSGALSAVAACLSLGAGAPVGQYGPLAHLGATLGAMAGRFMGGGPSLTRIGIGCGVAAAIATAFNAPIAGLVFAHEVILRHYSLRAFAPITVAATMGYMVANRVFVREPLFRIQDVAVANPLELVAFMLIGVFGALLAMTLMRSVLYAGQLSTRLSLPGPLKTALAGAAVGLVALQLPEVLGIGKETLRFAIIENAFGAGELALVIVARLLLTALCLGFGFAGGIFSPSLLIGVLFGALSGLGAAAVFGAAHSPLAIYGICGLVAVAGPVIGAPLTTILIVFELTRNYDVALAAMVSAAFANLVGYRVFGRSLFDVQLARRGIDLRLGRDKVMVQQRRIGDYLEQDFTRVDSATPLGRVRERLVDDANSEAYVVDADGRYLGTLSLLGLDLLERREVSPSAAAGDHAARESVVLSPDHSVWEAMTQMRDFVGESIPVVADDVLVGVVFESSIVSAYMGTLRSLREEEHASA